MPTGLDSSLAAILTRGTVIPAHPLALNSNRKLDERRQRALSRYYLAAGAGGVAFACHTTQFPIRHPKNALPKAVLETRSDETPRKEDLKNGGIFGERQQT